MCSIVVHAWCGPTMLGVMSGVHKNGQDRCVADLACICKPYSCAFLISSIYISCQVLQLAHLTALQVDGNNFAQGLGYFKGQARMLTLLSMLSLCHKDKITATDLKMVPRCICMSCVGVHVRVRRSDMSDLHTSELARRTLASTTLC